MAAAVDPAIQLAPLHPQRILLPHRMKTIVCQQPGTFVLEDTSPPEVGEGEALLRIHRIGICGTDLHAFQGNQAFFTYPRVLGHELSAEVISIPPNDRGLRPGDRVIVMPYIYCNNCPACRSGKTNCCQNMSVLGVHTDGGMREEIAVRSDLLLPAGELSHDEIAVVEPLAIGAHALRRADVGPADTVVVIGCGPIGIGIMALGAILGSRIIALDTNPDRLAFVREAIGIDDVVQVREDSIAQVREFTNGDMARVVIDATGNRRALESGHRYMSHGGTYVLVGLSKGDLTFQHPEIHAKEASILCSRNATLADFAWVKQVLESGRFPTEKYITHRAPFDAMIARFPDWLNPDSGVIKAVVERQP